MSELGGGDGEPAYQCNPMSDIHEIQTEEPVQSGLRHLMFKQMAEYQRVVQETKDIDSADLQAGWREPV